MACWRLNPARAEMVKMKKIWTWDAKTKRYRDERGRFLSASALTQLRDMYVDRAKNVATRLVYDYSVTGDIAAFRRGMRDLIKAIHCDMYSAGAGGWAQMTSQDWGHVGAFIKGEYKYLDGFLADVANGMGIAKMLWRAKLYVAAGTPMFERGLSSVYDLVLPEYPGDGNQDCLRSCRCHWDIVPTGAGSFAATWVLEETAEHCDTCVENSKKWAPLIVTAIKREKTLATT